MCYAGCQIRNAKVVPREYAIRSRPLVILHVMYPNKPPMDSVTEMFIMNFNLFFLLVNDVNVNV